MFAAQIKNLGDIRLGDHVFNTIDNDGVVWTIEDLDGWWYPPDSSIPDNQRSYIFDGSYDDDGRYESRLVTLKGFFIPLPGAPKYTIEKARERLIRSMTLVRRLGLLQVDESTSKIAYVRVVGGPKIGTTKLNGQTSFEIPLKAADPRKYNASLTVGGSNIYRANANTSGRRYTIPDSSNPNILTRAYNLIYGVADNSESGQFSVVNEGSYSTYGLVTFYGPVTNPTIENITTGSKISITRVLGIGETLTLNLQERSIILNQNTTLGNALERGSSWFVIPSGETQFRYTGVQHILAADPSPATTNYVIDPSFEGTSNTLYQTGSATNVVADNVTTPRVGSKSGAVTVTALGTAATNRIGYQLPVSGFQIGSGSLAVSTYYRGYWPPNKTLLAELVQYDAGSAVTSTQLLTVVRQTSSDSLYPRGYAIAAKDTTSVTAILRFFLAGNGTADQVNLVPNPSAEVNTSGWETGSIAPERSNQWNYIGNYSFRLYSSTVQNLSIQTVAAGTSNAIVLTPGTQYTTSAYMYPSSNNTGTGNGQLTISYYNSSNALISTSTGTATALNQGTATRVTLTDTAPTGTASAVLNVAVNRASVNSSDTFFVDNIMINVGASAVTYFDPSTNQSGIWNGTAHLSTSVLSRAQLVLDAAQLESNTRPTGYFDGDQPDGSWTGAANSSTSTRGTTAYVPRSKVEVSYRSAWI